MLLANHPKPQLVHPLTRVMRTLLTYKCYFLWEKFICVSSKLKDSAKAPKQRINTFFIFSSFSFLRYGHQIADIKPFPKLTSARLFSQEPRKKLFLRRHEASLKILEDKACTCKVPIKSSLFEAFVLFITTSAISYGDEA